MASAPHLIFSLHGSLYAVPALAVREIIWLPELTPLAQAPFSIVGVVNLRGKVVPIVDLNVRLGQGRQPCRVQDSVIVLEEAGTLIGIIVNEVRRVRSIAEAEMEAAPSSLSPGRGEEPAARFLAGVAKVEDDIIMLLHLENLLRLPGNPGDMAPAEPEGERPAPAAERSFCPEATPEERAIFRERARSLRQPLASQDFAGLIPLAVVGLNGEYFGIDLEIVREFSVLRAVTPVPCCPEYVVGQMNLRGDILTLVDIRAALNMPFTNVHNGTSDNPTGKVVVVQTDALKVGVLVDDVFDVRNLQPSEIHAVPAAAQSLSEEYLKGTAPCGAKMLSILDLPKILTQGALTVNEEA